MATYHLASFLETHLYFDTWAPILSQTTGHRHQKSKRVPTLIYLSLAKIGSNCNPLWPMGRRGLTRGRSTAEGTVNSAWNTHAGLPWAGLWRVYRSLQGAQRGQAVCKKTQNHQAKWTGATNLPKWWQVKDKAGNGGRSGWKASRAGEGVVHHPQTWIITCGLQEATWHSGKNLDLAPKSSSTIY